MTWSSCASVNAIGAIGLACSSNAGIGGGGREPAERLCTAGGGGVPLFFARAPGPRPAGVRPLSPPPPRPAPAPAADGTRLHSLFVFLSPIRHQLRQLRFGQFRHLKQSDALVTEIAGLRHLLFVRPPFFGARSRARRSHDLIFMLEPALI